MARSPRIDLPGYPQHVIQRGNDRQPCFRTEVDRALYLGILGEELARHECALHAYVLMTNHVHLLLTPSGNGGVGHVMQALGRKYVRKFNDQHQRTGTLWEGRYHACVVDSDTYLLRCSRYIELNPVRAAMVGRPADHRWSSYGFNALGRPDPLVRPHPSYLALGVDAGTRCRIYRELLDEPPPPIELSSIREHLRAQRALGSDQFLQSLESLTGRRIGVGVPGRPKRPSLPTARKTGI